jgi:hypothetical protein
VPSYKQGNAAVAVVAAVAAAETLGRPMAY